MYKFLIKELKTAATEKSKGGKEVTGVDVKYIDLDSRLGFPVKSEDVQLCLDSSEGKDKYPKRNDYIGFLKSENKKGETLKITINKSDISRTKLHKLLHISESTLWKLENNPTALNDKLKRNLRKEIQKLYKE